MSHRGKEINYTGLVYHVLHDAHAPLTVDEIVAGVLQLEPIHAVNPKALITGIVGQSNLIVPVEGGRYGYLPHLLEDNAFRQPLGSAVARRGFVELSPEAMTALWPGWTETRRSEEGQEAWLLLPDSSQAQLRRHFRLVGHWGFTASSEFWRWLEAGVARPDDDLLIRVLDTEARTYAGDLESHDGRDEETVRQRNRELADRALLAVRAAGDEILIERLAPLLIASGIYRHPIPPDPLLAVLAADGRFVDAGLGMVALLQGWTEADERLADERQRVMWQAVGEVRPRFRRASPEWHFEQEGRSFASLIMEGRLDEAVSWLQRENRIHTGADGEIRVDLEGLLEELPEALERQDEK